MESDIKSQKSQVYRYESIVNDNLLWIDIRNPTREKMNNLGRQYSFHELNIEDCLSKTQIPKIDKYDNHVFVILHFPTGSTDDKISRVTQLSIFIGTNYFLRKILVYPKNRNGFGPETGVGKENILHWVMPHIVYNFNYRKHIVA